MPLIKKWYDKYKTTKNTVRYHEVDRAEVELKPPRALYVQQDELADAFDAFPEKLVVTIEER